MRPVLSISYSLIFTSLSSSLDPSEASKSLARVWRTLLEDISSVALEPLNVTTTEKTQLNGNGGAGKKVVEGRKNGTKRMKESFDPSESMVRLRSAVDELDLDIAIKALSSTFPFSLLSVSLFALSVTHSEILFLSLSFGTTSLMSEFFIPSEFTPTLNLSFTTLHFPLAFLLHPLASPPNSNFLPLDLCPNPSRNN